MSDAQQGLAPDCLQRALRSRFRQQVKPGVSRTGHMRKKRPTSAQLIRGLEVDMAQVTEREQRRREQRETAAACAVDEAPLVREVRALGYDIDSVWDLVNNRPHPFIERRFLGPYERAYRVLVAHLGVPHHLRVREGIIRALTVKDGGREVETALLRELEQEPIQELRWVLANALRTAMPHHRRRKYPIVARALKDGSGIGRAG